jgi:hypothetical protein
MKHKSREIVKGESEHIPRMMTLETTTNSTSSGLRLFALLITVEDSSAIRRKARVPGRAQKTLTRRPDRASQRKDCVSANV